MKILNIIFISTLSLLSSQLMLGRGLCKETLPLVECTNLIIDQELSHFFEHVPVNDNEQITYWNLATRTTSSGVGYTIFRSPHNMPYLGNAYLQYGKNIIVILTGSLDDGVFREVPERWNEVSMKKMRRKDANKIVHAPFLELGINKTDYCFTSRSVYRNKEYFNPVSLSSHNTDIESIFEKIKYNCILKDEIKNFLRLLSQKETNRYFLLRVREEEYTYQGDTVYSCFVAEINEKYDMKNVYLKDGNNIVLVGSNVNDLFLEEDLDVFLSLSLTSKQLLFKLSIGD